MLQDQIAERLGMDQSTISKRITGLKGEISRIMGNSYEKFVKTLLERQENVTEVEHHGGSNEPDLIIYYKNESVEVRSCKCYNSNRRSSWNRL